MFISINHIPVKSGREEDFERMFQERQRAVENQAGFVSMDVLTPGKRQMMGGPPEPAGCEYQVLTRWESEADFRNWLKSDDFKKAHSREVDSTIFDGRSYLTLHPTVDGASACKTAG